MQIGTVIALGAIAFLVWRSRQAQNAGTASPTPTAPTEHDPGWTDYAANWFSDTTSGAVAGSSINVGWGTLAGAVAGTVIGLGRTFADDMDWI